MDGNTGPEQGGIGNAASLMECGEHLETRLSAGIS